jgi:hypothetical protein
MDALWGVGLAYAPIARFLDEDFVPEVHWLDVAPFGQYYADPFALPATGPGPVRVFCEAYDYARRRGHIVSFAIDPGAQGDVRLIDPPRVALAARHHLSFPAPVVDETGRVYAVPEQGATGRVTLYRADDDANPTRFAPHADLVGSLDAADPILFRHRGLYWLLVTDRTYTLYAYFAPDLATPFVAHPMNPLTRDAGGTRAAGLPFVHQGSLFRPVQDGRRRYGGAIAITEVRRLDPEGFEERVVRRLEPFDARFPLGLHTLSAAGPVTLLDGLRPSRVPPFARALAGFVSPSVA